MLSIIICGLLLCVSIMIIAQGIDFISRTPNKNINIRMFFYLCLAGMINNVCYSATVVMHESITRYTLEAVIWCTGIAFMGITVYLLAFLLDTDAKRTTLYTSIVLYMGIIFYIVDVILQGGLRHIDSWKNGHLYEPPFRIIVALILCLLYVYFIISMVFSYRNRRSRKRERVIYQLIMLVCILTLAANVGETIMHFMSIQAIPFRSLFMVVTVWCLKKAYFCHDALEICEKDYSEVLESNSNEPVVICNDEGTIVFMNKCAVIASVEEKEPLVGRLMTDLFTFSGGTAKDFFMPHTGAYSLTGIYNPTGRRCNLTVQNVYDAYGEVFTYIVTVYRLDNVSQVPNHESAAEEVAQESNITENIAVTEGAKILLVDDSPSTLKLLESVMKPFQMQTERAYSGEEAIQLLENGHRYDMIFIDHMMPDMDGVETTKQIRAMDGDYFSVVPIVFCTSTSIEESLTEFLKVRFNDFLSKPVSVKSLSDILTRWLWNRVTADKQQVTAPEEEIPTLPTSFGIKGIDEKLASKYIGDNETMYLALLHNFLKDMKDMVKDLEDFYQYYDRMRFRIFTHAMDAACKGIGAVELSGKAEKLEQACLNEDNQYIAANIQDYIFEFKELLKSIEAYLNTRK